MTLTNSFVLFALSLALITGCAPTSENQIDTDQTTAQGMIGGVPVGVRSTNAARSVVVIQLQNKFKQAVSFCSGTLIGPHTVLTAAHCFKKDKSRGQTGPDIEFFSVVFENTYSQTKPYDGTIRYGAAFVVHPDFGFDKLNNDVALGVFFGDIPKGYQPVNIDSNDQADYSNMEVYDYGYGHQKEPGNVVVPLKTAVLQRGVMRINGNYKAYPDRYLTSPQSPSQVCKGDSGGPQFYHEKGVLKIIGINSGAMARYLFPEVKDMPLCAGPSQMTKVSYFYSWIQKIQKQLLSQFGMN